MTTSKGHLIDQFMWGYQSHFRSNVQFAAERALTALGLPVEPVVFLVGFMREGYKGGHDVCIEPERGSLAQTDFDRVAARAAELREQDPEREIWHSDARLHAAGQKGIR